MPYEAIVAIDKIKKIGDEGVLAEMEKKGIPQEKAREYLSYVKNLQPNEEISFILNYLKNYGFSDDWYSFDPTIARSFSYSMGPIWEVEIPDAGYNMSVLGGERYDGLLQKFAGRDIGGTGFAVGFDRTLEAAEIMGLIPTLSVAGQVLVTIFSKDMRANALEIAKTLRAEGVAADVYPAADKLEKQLKYADKNTIPYVIIQGPDEAAKNTVTLKNMKTKEQKEVSLPELPKLFAND